MPDVLVALGSFLDILYSLIDNRLEFKKQYERIKKDLEALRPILDREPANSELENLRIELEKGTELTSKCAKLPIWSVVKQHIYAGQLEELDEAVQRILKTEVLRGVRKLQSWTEKFNSKLDALLAESEGGELPLPPGRVFGMEQPLIEVKERVRRHQVVNVCGIGGSGKTTLVQKLCMDGEIIVEYGEPIFLRVAGRTDLQTILQKLLKRLHKLNNDGAFPTEAAASGRRGKMLIVLDDVWSDDEGVIRDLVFAIKGAENSKILITSRTKLGGLCDWCHTMNLLSEDDARKLFEHHAFNGADPERSRKPNKDLIDKIVRGCMFHPLALKVIGSSLANKDEREWQDTANRLKEIGGKIITDRLSISLDRLTKEQYECFLDFGSFPEDQMIPASAIIDMWIETRGMNENRAYVTLQELGRRNLVKLVDRKCGDAGDPDGSFSSLSVTQHDVLRELAIHKSKVESPITRLIMENREDNIPETWTREKDRTSHAKLVSINTGDIKSSNWLDVDLPNAEVLILNFSGTSYCLPPFLQRMKKLKVLVVANHGSNRAELDGLSLLSSLNKLKRVMFRKISLPAEPLRIVEGGSRLWSGVQKFISVISKTIGASPEQPQDLHKLSLVLCDVHHLLHIPSLFPSVRDLEIDYCINLDELPETICQISSLEKLSITNFPDLLRLPESIDKLSKLKVLRLQACGTLQLLPHSVSQLSELRFLDISNCYSLGAFPEEIGKLNSLEKIDMRCCSGIEELPPSLVQMEHLKTVVCDEEVALLWTSYGFDPSKLHVRREEVNLIFLRR